MIPAHLHGYAVRALLERLMHADIGNVRFWHRAVMLIELKIRCEREAGVNIIFYQNNYLVV